MFYVGTDPSQENLQSSEKILMAIMLNAMATGNLIRLICRMAREAYTGTVEYDTRRHRQTNT